MCPQNLGTVPAQSSKPLTLRLIAVEPGIQRIGGMQFIDALSEHVHEAGTLADVYVHNRA